MRTRKLATINGSQASAFGLVKVAQEWTQIHLNPGEIATVTAKSVTTNATVTVGLNWAEEF